MDTPIHQLELVRPWRTATLVAAGIAAVELALLVVAGLILVGRSIAPHAHSAAAATSKAASGTPPRRSRTSPRSSPTCPARRSA